MKTYIKALFLTIVALLVITIITITVGGAFILAIQLKIHPFILLPIFAFIAIFIKTLNALKQEERLYNKKEQHE